MPIEFSWCISQASRYSRKAGNLVYGISRLETGQRNYDTMPDGLETAACFLPALVFGSVSASYVLNCLLLPIGFAGFSRIALPVMRAES